MWSQNYVADRFMKNKTAFVKTGILNMYVSKVKLINIFFLYNYFK